MAKPVTRKNSANLGYYQNLADIIGIFWQFHKARIADESISFACMSYKSPSGKRIFTDYDASFRSRIRPYRVLKDFGLGISHTMDYSWQQFLQSLGRGYNSLPEELTMPVSDSAQRFIDPEFIGPLLDNATELIPDSRDHKELKDLVSPGITTGVVVPLQLRGIFGEDFNPRTAIILSKVSLNFIPKIDQGIGMTFDENGNRVDQDPPEYALLNNSAQGVNHTLLREYGLGRVLGCPASMKVSEKTRLFLEGKGIRSPRIVTTELAEMIDDKFDPYIGNWYRGLGPEARRAIIDPETIKILDGDIRRSIKPEGQCPYPLGRRIEG